MSDSAGLFLDSAKRQMLSVAAPRTRFALKCRVLSLRSEPWVFSRTACLGNDALALCSREFRRVNLQKGRVDLVLDRLAQHIHRPPLGLSQLPTMMARTDVLPLIAVQSETVWTKLRPPRAVVLDSFSELADQRFDSRDGHWAFASAWTDVHHTPKFNSHFRCSGLLDVEALTRAYTELFGLFRSLWGRATPIAFIHFPTNFEVREDFVYRGDQIRHAVEEAGLGDPLVFSISVPNEFVERPSDSSDDFPYHYGETTKRFVADRLNAIIGITGEEFTLGGRP